MNAFVFGDGWAAYRGHSSDNSPHRHAAIQLVFGSDRAVCVVDADGQEFSGHTIVIQPMVEHRLIAKHVVSMLYLEPQTPLAFRVMGEIAGGDINIVDDRGFLGFDSKITIQEWVVNLLDSVPRSRSTVDHRLFTALQQLAENPNEMQIASLAENLGLSDSRLRFLARHHLGFPLSTWLLWRKLDRAARALHDGETLVDAALLGGFSDQAHLSRTMRRMFGMTPRAVQGLTPVSSGR
ncbi:Transcriptional regulator, AraC family [Sphingopyxis sp. LC81]|jgi:AraC-like DNA-binding protein|uniref:AraC family transcriptional regulator n=1 Tax=Sphingopyxis sp. LC81 TaxID=1502850 RepID=UPI00050FA3DA|nr:AraC family transcriptional regulator [Sphingopyxis sp. LC81]KGB54695.1 Transcriptional regulator, AraC family [Sphingopyxis sp. LC81]